MEKLRNPSFSYLDRGKRFTSYTNGERVVKISNECYSEEKASAKIAELQDYYYLLHTYLDKYVVPSEFSMQKREDGLYMFQIEQPFITGQNWHGILRSMKDSYEYMHVIDFCRDVLQ